MFEPTTLPMAMSPLPRKDATREVESSGRLVPTATTVRPMTASLTLRARARITAPSTKRTPPPIRAPRPTATRVSWTSKLPRRRGAWAASSAWTFRLSRRAMTSEKAV